MGKGDKRTRKGKIYAGSYGNVRPHSSVVTDKVAAKPAPVAKKAPAKKAAARKA